MAVRVLKVDDQETFPAAAREVIRATEGFEIAGEAGTGEDPVEAARRLRPDLVMDINLPGIDGIEASRRIRSERAEVVVFLLSTYDPAEFMLETLGLAHRANHRPDQVSGGEQQRVAVARALVHQPAVVWADEPTGNLDTEVTQVIVELLIRMNKQGQTIVLVTHNPLVAERAARMGRKRDGRFEQPGQADRTVLRAAER